MIIGERLRQLRKQKNMSQGDVGEKTGLMPAYISRVENGHTVPSVATLEKFAQALEIRIYELFYDGEEPPALISGMPLKAAPFWGSGGEDAAMLAQFRRTFSNLDEKERRFVLAMARKLSEGQLHNKA
jgi:transcriptional regulator with XRE-family HTH domain